MDTDTRCPCGSGDTYAACCRRYHDGLPAPTAETLMRSRFTAFAIGDVGYLRRTWHPDTRPDSLDLDPGQRWVRLDVLGVFGGGLLDSEGTVDFQAHYRRDGVRGVQSEVSTFRREGSAWRYVDGVRSLR